MTSAILQRFGGLTAGMERSSELTNLILATVLINVLALALPLMLLQIYDRIIPNQGIETLTLLVVGVGVALILECVLRYLRSSVSAWMGARFEHRAGLAAYSRFLDATLTDYEKVGPGVHLENYNALVPLKELYGGQILLTLCDLPFALLFLGVIAYLAGWLVVVPVAIIVLFALTAWINGRAIQKALSGRAVSDDRRFSFLIEVLSGIHTIKGLAMEEQMLRRYERLQESSAGSEFEVSRLNANAAGVGVMFAQLTLFLVVASGAVLVIGGSLSVGGLAACTLLAGRAMQPLQRAVGVWARFQRINLARAQIQKVFALAQETTEELPHLSQVAGRIEIEDVHFSFEPSEPGAARPVLFKGLNLTVEPGEAIGMFGPNASGRTSFLYLILGLYRPTQGTVRLDGRDIAEYDPSSVRREVAYVPQHGQLFEGTILENISMFRPDKAEEARDSARILGLESIIMEMPRGYDTKVGDGSTDKLPRGLVQRIAIARALVDRPRVLLFDEANSAMDGAADRSLRDLLVRLKGRVTMILVTPRPSLLNIADRVITLQDGELTERRVTPLGGS